MLVYIVGAIFFSLWTVLFGAVGSTGLVAADRRQSFEQIKNGIITPLVYCTGQYIATVPYNLLCAIVFQAVFHWLTNINPLFVSFVYGIMLTFGLLTTMESLMFIVVEVGIMLDDGMQQWINSFRCAALRWSKMLC